MILSVVISLILLFSGESLNQEVNSFLAKKLLSFDKYEFEVIHQPEGKIRISEDGAYKLSGSFLYIPVIVNEENRRDTQSYLTLKVTLYRKVLIANRIIERGMILDTSVVEVLLKDVTNTRGTTITDPSEIKKMRSTVKVNKGEILQKEFMEPEPDIKYGNIVTAVSGTGYVTVSIKAEAKQDGAAGDIIRIITVDNKQLKARIIDSLNVKIVE